MNNIVVSLFIFSFGAIIGSFLNVVILRHNTGQSIVKSRSGCMSCGKKLGWFELVPIFSFIFQKGKCWGCKSKISWQYPLVEIMTGGLFLMIWNYELGIRNYVSLIPNSLFLLLNSVYLWVVFSLLVIITVYDYRHQIIPDRWVYSFITLSFFAVFLEFKNLSPFGKSPVGGDFGFRISADFVNSFLSGVFLASFFAVLYFGSGFVWEGFKKGGFSFDVDKIGRAMGFGDVKLALGIGWFLGSVKGLIALLLSFWIGGAVSIFLLFLARKRYNIKSKIAFGPFLVLGTFISFFWGEVIFTFLF